MLFQVVAVLVAALALPVDAQMQRSINSRRRFGRCWCPAATRAIANRPQRHRAGCCSIRPRGSGEGETTGP